MSESTSESDLKRLDAMGDEDIDYSEIPELDNDFFGKAKKLTKEELAKSLRSARSE